MPCPGPGLYLGRGVFGGFGEGKGKTADMAGNPGWFEGYLRSLRVETGVWDMRHGQASGLGGTHLRQAIRAGRGIHDDGA